MEADAEPEFGAAAVGSIAVEDMVEADDMDRDSEPELVPVAASIFDDDFFSTQGRNRATAESETFGSAVAVQPASAPASIEEGARLFAGASGSQAEHPETDELDIPAFLRRSR